MTFKKTSIFLLVLIVAMSIFMVPIVMPSGTDGVIEAEAKGHLPLGYANTTTYTYDDRGYQGERTIYWAEGVNAPKMDSLASGNLGTDGYFARSVDKTFITYDYPMETGNGYYDFNKTVDTRSSHCYLAAASNLIHWWIDQNSANIDRYIDMIENGTFSSIPSLRDTSKITRDMWEKMRSELQLREENTVITQPLFDDYLVNQILSPFVARTSGFWPDRVHDFFFNGYKYSHEDTGEKLSSPDNFTPDSRGGIFHAIFGTELLTDRMTSSNYVDYKEVFAQAFASGHGVALEIIPVRGKGGTHAITIWGAEYDDRGELTALYLTDSDDYQSMRDKVAYGMRRRAIVNDNGRMLMNDSSEFNGYYVRSLSLLSLGKEQWQAALNDSAEPEGAVILADIEDQHYSLGATYTNDLVLDVDEPKRGYYTYEWYESSSDVGDGTLISGAETNRLRPDSAILGKEGTRYYYAKVSHIKNGKIKTIESRRAKVAVGAEYVDALQPKLDYSSTQMQMKSVFRNQYIAPFKVSATSPDNGTISYQWYMKIGGNTSDATIGATPIEGATTSSYQPDTNNSRPTTYYFCRVTNTKQDASGQKSVYADSGIKTVRIKTLFDALEPLIFEHPADATYEYNAESQPLYVRAKSNDGGVLSFQWYRATSATADGVQVGTNSDELAIDTTVSGTFYYYVVITNTNEYAENGKTATLTSNRAKVTVGENTTPEPPAPVLSSNSYLSGITIGDYVLSPVFHKETLTYSITVPHDVTSVTISATTEHVNAHYAVSGGDTLNVGNNTATILVTAEDGSTRTYTINITREAAPEPPAPVLSNNSYLSGITIGDYVLSPVFHKETLTYSITVPHDVTSVTISATTEHVNAHYAVSGGDTLNVGNNTATILVTAEDGSTKTYTININREVAPEPPAPVLSSNSYLAGITIGDYVLSPVFHKDTLTYSITVPHDVTSVTISATTEHVNARYAVSGGDTLNVGNNTVTILVTAEDGSTKTYTININREAAPEPEPETKPEPDTPVIPDGGDNGGDVTPEPEPETKPEPDTPVIPDGGDNGGDVTPEPEPETKPEPDTPVIPDGGDNGGDVIPEPDTETKPNTDDKPNLEGNVGLTTTAKVLIGVFTPLGIIALIALAVVLTRRR